MTDSLSPEKRSWNMSRIRNSDTKIELKVRKYLFSLGFRYRKNVAALPGKPDIVLKKYKTIIFIHGCFWHRHPGCKDTSMPKTRTEFWQSKFAKNIKNDEENQYKLASSGWQIIILWECQINKQFEQTMMELVEKIIHPAFP